MRLGAILLIGLGGIALLVIGFGGSSAQRPGSSDRGLFPDREQERPIAAADSLWIEKLTWMEVRDAIRAGKTTAIVPTGGVEQNGPYVVTGKHNVILGATAEAVARKLGNALVAPVVPFVPEGPIEPADGPGLYPGTISVEDSTFAALLRDIGRSLRASGFKTIVFIGDSGGNQQGMEAVAAELDKAWAGTGVRAIFVPEYYDWPGRQNWLAARGHKEVDEGLHDELAAETILLSADPTAVRVEQRRAAGKLSINGVSLEPVDRMAGEGRALVDHVAGLTAEAVRKRLGN